MLESLIFHMPDELQASPAVTGVWKQSLLDLLVEAEVLGYANDVETACATFLGWCLAREPRPVGALSVASLPGLPWKHAEWDAWAWYDDLMAEVATWDPPPILVDLSDLLITRGNQVLWPEDGEPRRRVDRRTHTADSPIASGWFGHRLGDFRPGTRTYECWPPEELSPIAVSLTGDFHWLERCGPHARSIAANAAETEAALAALLGSNRAELPEDFVHFFRGPMLWNRIRSCTGCYLNLDSTAVEIRGGLGRLIHFMSDSQGCLQWSLYLSPDRKAMGVVATYFFAGSRADDDPKPVHPRDVTLCASSFEEFMYRFWLENELWFAINDRGEMPEHGDGYLAHLRNITSP